MVPVHKIKTLLPVKSRFCGPETFGPFKWHEGKGGGGRAVNIVCMYRMFIYGVQFDNVYKFIYKNYTDLREDYLNTLTEADI